MPDPASLQRHPWWYRSIKSAYRFGDYAGISRPLQVDRLLNKAIRSQQRDFTDKSFLPGLEALVSSANTEAKLNGFGRVMLRALIGRYLKQRLLLEQWREAHPEVNQENIVRPLMIVGLPRTGTTFLHQLLSQDEQFRAPRTFEIDRPVPPPAENAIHLDPRVREIQRGIDVIHRIVPHFQSIHPLGAVLPDECQQITAYQFSSIAYQHIMELPSFRRWLLNHDFTEDIVFHRQFLQHLQSAWRRQHWLLKSPAHIQYLPTLLHVYPDAMIVQTHRDPDQVIASVASLSWTMQSVFSDHIDKYHCGRAQLDFFREALGICLQDRKALAQTKNIFDLSFQSLVSQPMAMVERIYQHFGLVLAAATKTRMKAFIIDSQQRNKHGGHHYSAQEFGLNDMADVPEFIEYRKRFIGGV